MTKNLCRTTRPAEATVIALPTINEQNRIIQRLAAISKQAETGESQVKKHRQQKHGHMHALLAGRVQVSEFTGNVLGTL